uniref:Uncharacterized protein MANES_01G262900 n=1 Tax=Rhizophora mucronata TaxID=61149 RepID=A0A2P2KFM9_RHIMU
MQVHYPTEAIHNIPFSDSKMQLLEAQKADMRCLLPKSLLDYGFFPLRSSKNDSNDKFKGDQTHNFSWSGQRKTPSYIHKLVFPDEFLAALRTIAMREDELFKVSSLLEELVGSLVERQPTDSEVRAAVWEACGDSGALQLLVDLLHMKMMDMEESSRTEGHDDELLVNVQDVEGLETHRRCENSLSNLEATGATQPTLMTRNQWSSMVYRQGQKELTRLFLREAEHCLQLSLSEGN